MALYAISDLHLPLGIDKPMNIFGSSWDNYVQRLRENWQNTVGENDTVVLPGDLSWATYLKDAKPDFEFVENLNGKKIISKGNHDYWWETMNKMNLFLKDNNFKSISFLQNNSFEYNDIAICGTRGWLFPNNEENEKMYQREAARLELSLSAAAPEKRKFVFLHYPPIIRDNMKNDFTEIMKKYNVELCVYGHLHAKSSQNALTGYVDGIKYLLVSCDYMGFMPIKLSD